MIFTFLIGLVIGLIVGYILGIRKVSNIQISGDNSTQVQIEEKDEDDV